MLVRVLLVLDLGMCIENGKSNGIIIRINQAFFDNEVGKDCKTIEGNAKKSLKQTLQSLGTYRPLLFVNSTEHEPHWLHNKVDQKLEIKLHIRGRTLSNELLATYMAKET
ncbi:hypothetical protein YC2023_051574 [Brassica napus]